MVRSRNTASPCLLRHVCAIHIQTSKPCLMVKGISPHGGSEIQLGFVVVQTLSCGLCTDSPMEMEEISKQMKLLLEVGYIRPSQSLDGAPVLFVKKPRSIELRIVLLYIRKATARVSAPLQHPPLSQPPRCIGALSALGGQSKSVAKLPAAEHSKTMSAARQGRGDDPDQL